MPPSWDNHVRRLHKGNTTESHRAPLFLLLRFFCIPSTVLLQFCIAKSCLSYYLWCFRVAFLLAFLPSWLSLFLHFRGFRKREDLLVQLKKVQSPLYRGSWEAATSSWYTVHAGGRVAAQPSPPAQCTVQLHPVAPA